MKQAIVAVEDKRFYEHNGVDVRGILRAALGGHPQQGGRRGRLDDHAAVRQERVQPQRPDDRAQGARGGARLAADAAVVEGPDPHRVPQHDLLRERRLRRPPGGPDLLRREERRGADAARGGTARRYPGEPLAVRPGAASARQRGSGGPTCCSSSTTRVGSRPPSSRRRTRGRCRSPRTSVCRARAGRHRTSSTTSPTSSWPSTAPSGSSAAASR